MYADIKRELIGQAKGRVLEIGAGTGETVKYYRKRQVDVVYGVEPNVDVLGNLRKQLAKHDLVDKYEVLQFGVEDEARMTEAGVQPGSIDTIVCVRRQPIRGLNVGDVFVFGSYAGKDCFGIISTFEERWDAFDI